ncbi:hypothetical protein [Luteolibacter soli]|uniref:Methyltransferase FkbM domain-containing protein n=1 Tax=Luteolibacter soli TaxID=3135280 RepID=A0ABU9ASW9_9BACT
MKEFLRRVAELLVSNETLWTPVRKTLVRGSQFLCAMRESYEADRVVAETPALRNALAARLVVAGPFQGMKYGNTEARCSTLYPKLLGTYENELAAEVDAAIAKRHAIVVDVGAADGYYAVGFAYRNPDAKIIAFEQDPRAQVELEKLAALNGVSDRIDVRGHCGPGDIQGLSGKSGLVIVDCEGFEDKILSEENIRHLRGWDFIIETHDGFSPEVTKRLEARFAGTHEVRQIDAIHDYDKLDHVEVPLLKGLPRRAADKVVAEGREHACLRWLCCTPRMGNK